MLKNKVILVTGGSGSVGSALVEKLLAEEPHAIRIFDNNEDSLFKLKRKLGGNKHLRFLLGDLRDRERVNMAVSGCDIIYHVAAIKNIEISEYNPVEAIRTNVEGTINTLLSTLQFPPEKYIFISSDKSVDFTSLYGATKFIGEKLTLWGQQISDYTKYSVIRFGNIMETRGNIFDIWDIEKEAGRPLPITHPDMKRFFIPLAKVVNITVELTKIMTGGEIFVPISNEYCILDLAKKISADYVVIGMRDGEKLRESLISESEKEKVSEMSLNGGECIWVITNRS